MGLLEVYGLGGPKGSVPHGTDDRYTSRSEPFHPDERKMIDRIRSAVHAEMPGARIVLFGSRARDDWRPDSDFDVWVDVTWEDDVLAQRLEDQLGPDVQVFIGPAGGEIAADWPQVEL